MRGTADRVKGGFGRSGWDFDRVAAVKHEKTASVLATIGGMLIPRMAVSAANAYLRRPNSPLQPYYRRMASQGLKHGLRGGNRTLLPRLRRPLLSLLGPATGFGEYELGLSLAKGAREAYRAGRRAAGPGVTPMRSGLRVDSLDKLREMAAMQSSSTLQSQLMRNMSDGAADFLRNPTLRMTPQERRWTSLVRPRLQGRLTLLGGALRGGVTEAALSPHAPVSGFVRGAAVGAAEFSPDAATVGYAARGNNSPLLYFKSRLVDAGAKQHQTPTRLGRWSHAAISAYDPNMREALRVGKDLADVRNRPMLSAITGKQPVDSVLGVAVDHELEPTRHVNFKDVVAGAVPSWLQRRWPVTGKLQPT